ncbi:aspartyl-phosphate phosphatase Spo0E family protein [Bacillus sp. FJAT-27231]|uniref:aspartyl-phosphate phosphatase Spo0E family protein n=1 Tax=Bacillus sp. FJAT-27231 TaxID=1679168 RepID=UPI0009E4584D|nr:aspartyl-phosphate phosphatase Spo0E family protein [Bacillus sp. FJAT-27231]
MKRHEMFNDLVAEINSKRKLMIKVGMAKGLHHFETIQYSEELDKLIYKYQSLIKLPNN